MAETAVLEQTTSAAPAATTPASVPATPVAATEQTKPVAETTGQSTTTAPTGTEPPASGPPEKYELLVPEEAVLSAEARADFEGEAKFLGLTNDKAQALLTQRITKEFERRAAVYARTEADPTYGGANLAQTQKLAESVLNRFATKGDPLGDEFRLMMRTSGAGDALPIVAVLAKIGKAMAEDTPVATGTGAIKSAPKSDAEVFYGSKPS